MKIEKEVRKMNEINQREKENKMTICEECGKKVKSRRTFQGAGLKKMVCKDCEKFMNLAMDFNPNILKGWERLSS